PRAEHDDRSHERGEQDEKQRHAVEAHVVAEAQVRRPLRALLERETAHASAKPRRERNREHERGDRGDERDALLLSALLARQERDHQRAKQRREDDQAEQMRFEKIHLSPAPGTRRRESPPRAPSPPRTVARLPSRT